MNDKLNQYPEEGETMADNNFGTNDIITGRGLGIGGFGYGAGYGGGGMYPGNNVLAANAHADGTAVKTAIDCGMKATAAGLDRTADQAEETRRVLAFDNINKNITDGEFRSSDRLTAVNKNITDSEFRSLDRQRDTDKTLAAMAAANALCCCDTQKAIADAAKEAAKCCCEAQLAACKAHAEITATVLADGALTREMIRGDALAAANAKITQLETINALGNSHHHR